ncbi:MAG: RHS repeat-associated core domain-containing protein [Candidatus Electrothrix sp. AW2]|nr:RHS repeat-associated core domain-containing protein [Candidatus Electrothrix gigas]
MPVAMTAGGANYYLGYDQVGSLRTVADASGSVVKEISYDSFGTILSDSNPAFAVPFGFAGGLHDRDTGLVKFGFRDYDPAIGRWVAKDPILFAGGDVDLYGYVLGDPVNFVDPDGLKKNSDILCEFSRGFKYKDLKDFLGNGVLPFVGGVADEIAFGMGTQLIEEFAKATNDNDMLRNLERYRNLDSYNAGRAVAKVKSIKKTAKTFKDGFQKTNLDLAKSHTKRIVKSLKDMID